MASQNRQKLMSVLLGLIEAGLPSGALVTACLCSFLLVLLSGGTIGLIQFQPRLLNATNGFSFGSALGQIVPRDRLNRERTRLWPEN